MTPERLEELIAYHERLKNFSVVVEQSKICDTIAALRELLEYLNADHPEDIPS